MHVLELLSEAVKTYEEVNSEIEASDDISKRSIETEDYGDSLVSGNSTVQDSNVCRSEVWQCMSGVMETGIKYIDRPEQLYTSLTPVLYKAVFHGGLKNMWTSAMQVSKLNKVNILT